MTNHSPNPSSQPPNQSDSCSDRYSDRVDQRAPNTAEFQGLDRAKGDDTHRRRAGAYTPNKRYSQAAIRRLKEDLSERDMAILDTLQNFRFARLAHLRLAQFNDLKNDDSAKRVARRVMQRLTNSSLVVRLERRIGGVRAGSDGFIYALAPLGHRVLGQSKRKRFHEPTLHHLRHTLAITEIGTEIAATADELDVRISMIETEPRCWREFADETAKPDLFVELATTRYDLSWFVEVDLGTESSRVIADKARRYTRLWQHGSEQRDNGVFPRVLWVAPDQVRCDFIAHAILNDSEVEPQLFAYCTSNNAVNVLADIDGGAS